MTSGEKVALALGALAVAGGAGWLIYEKTKKTAVAPGPPPPPQLPPPPPPTKPATIPEGVLAQKEAYDLAAAQAAAAQAGAAYYEAMAEQAAQAAGGTIGSPAGEPEGPMGTPAEWEIPLPGGLGEYELPGAFY